MWFLLFFITPIVEMYLLIRVGGYIGAWPTVGLVMLTAVIGVTLLRIQGLATLTRGLNRLEGGELPAREVVEGLLLAVAGALLLTPGFVTDTAGFALLIPALRSRVAERVLARVVVGSAQPFTGPAAARRPSASRGQVLEGEFERVGDTPDSAVRPDSDEPRR